MNFLNLLLKRARDRSLLIKIQRWTERNATMQKRIDPRNGIKATLDRKRSSATSVFWTCVRTGFHRGGGQVGNCCFRGLAASGDDAVRVKPTRRHITKPAIFVMAMSN